MYKGIVKSLCKGMDVTANLAQTKINALNRQNPAVSEIIAAIQDDCKSANIRETTINPDQVITNKVKGGMHKSKILTNKSNRF
jgi:hypothetical protein